MAVVTDPFLTITNVETEIQYGNQLFGDNFLFIEIRDYLAKSC